MKFRDGNQAEIREIIIFPLGIPPVSGLFREIRTDLERKIGHDFSCRKTVSIK